MYPQLFLQIIGWWLIIQLLGLVSLPLTYRLFSHLPDRGYSLTKPLSLLLINYILWLGGTFNFLRNNIGGILLAIFIAAGISVWYYFKTKNNHQTDSETGFSGLSHFIQSHKPVIIATELLFTLAFIGWAILRAYAVDKIMSSGGEKFMEVAFLNGILNSAQFPPVDPWLSGFAISYYYFGYVMLATLTQLSGVASGIGFDLYNAVLFALTMTGAFGIVHNLIASNVARQHNHATQSITDSRSLGWSVLGAVFVGLLGNLEGLLEILYARGILPTAFWHWIDIPDLIEVGTVTQTWYPGHHWWWWRASRIIEEYDLLSQSTGWNPITEFPFFSFLLGDNHPHVLALPFVLLSISLAFNLLNSHSRLIEDQDTEQKSWSLNQIFAGSWITFSLYALLLGSLGFLNTWDLPIYIGLTALAYGIGLSTRINKFKIAFVWRTIVLAIGLMVGAVILYFPFYISFSSQAGGLLPYLLSPTHLGQYLIMFGPFLFIIACFLGTRFLIMQKFTQSKTVIYAVIRWWSIVIVCILTMYCLIIGSFALSDAGRQTLQQIAKGLPLSEIFRLVAVTRLQNPWLFLSITLFLALIVVNFKLIPLFTETNQVAEHLSASDIFVLLLIGVGLALTLSVEFVYLKDNFGVRMNTVFKFYYQGWLMFACASAYGIWWIKDRARPFIGLPGQSLFFIGVAPLVIAGLIYPILGGYSRVHGFQGEPNLNGEMNLAIHNDDDWAAITWLRHQTKETPISAILEAPGKSYNYEGRISAFTGIPTLLGWALHEGQWRGNYDEQSKREPDIMTIFRTHDAQEALDLLTKWQVDYVIVGLPEQRYVEQLCRDAQGDFAYCLPDQSLRKFERILDPVFQHGMTTIYRVPN